MNIPESTPQCNGLPAKVYSAAVAIAWAVRRNPRAGVVDLARLSGRSRQQVYRAQQLATELQPLVDQLSTDDDLRAYLARLPEASAGVTEADVAALRAGDVVGG